MRADLMAKIKKGIAFKEYIKKQADDIQKQNIGQRIYYLRTSNDLTQEEFAELVGTTKATVSLWENNVRCPGRQSRVHICRTFEISQDSFFLQRKEAGK